MPQARRNVVTLKGMRRSAFPARQYAATIVLLVVVSMLLATHSTWYPGYSRDSLGVPLGALSVNIMALTYAYLIGFQRSSIHFERTTRKWKLVLLLALVLAGLLWILFRNFDIEFSGYVLAGLIFAFCLLWFDTDVKREMAEEQRSRQG